MTQHPQDNLRGELQDAIAKVRQQIDREMSGSHYIGSESIEAEDIAGLRAELAELEQALTNLGSA